MNQKSLESKKRSLQWALDFVQLDLDSLPELKFMELWVGALYIASSWATRHTFEEFLEFKPHEIFLEIKGINESELKMLEDNLSDGKWKTLDDLLAPLSEETLKKLQKYGILPILYGLKLQVKLREIQKALRSIVERMVNLASSAKVGEAESTMELSPATPVLGIIPPGKEQNSIGNYDFYFRPFETSPVNWASINLGRLLDGLAIHSVMKCKGCGRYFLNLTLKKKIYCNFACASRTIARERYEELKKDPKKYEAHLKKYRKYSEKRYRRLREMQYGPNVKIQKRNNGRKEG